MKTKTQHELKIISLHDVQLECSCSWKLTSTYGITRSEAKKMHDKHVYGDFVFEWGKTHSLSKAPSFTSWKANYKNN